MQEDMQKSLICKKLCHHEQKCKCNVQVKKSLLCGHLMNVNCYLDTQFAHWYTLVPMISMNSLHTINIRCIDKTKYDLAESDTEKQNILKKYTCKELFSVELKACRHYGEKEKFVFFHAKAKRTLIQ